VARRDDEAEPIARAGFAVLAATLENPGEAAGNLPEMMS
jgi:hypothetical protein